MWSCCLVTDVHLSSVGHFATKEIWVHGNELLGDLQVPGQLPFPESWVLQEQYSRYQNQKFETCCWRSRMETVVLHKTSTEGEDATFQNTRKDCTMVNQDTDTIIICTSLDFVPALCKIDGQAVFGN